MKHIKTPVSVAGYDIGSVYEANGSELCCCYGMVEDQRNKSAEIAMALNAHDLLVKVLTTVAHLACIPNFQHTFDGILDQEGQTFNDDIRSAALALVRREGEE